MSVTVFTIFTTSGCTTSQIMVDRLTKATQHESKAKNLEFATLRGLCDVQIVSLDTSSGKELARLYKVSDAPTIVCAKTYSKGNVLVGLKDNYTIRKWIREQLKIINNKKD